MDKKIDCTGSNRTSTTVNEAIEFMAAYTAAIRASQSEFVLEYTKQDDGSVLKVSVGGCVAGKKKSDSKG